MAVLQVARRADARELSLETLDATLDKGSAVTQDGAFLARGRCA
jgi:hypothetical protein